MQLAQTTLPYSKISLINAVFTTSSDFLFNLNFSFSILFILLQAFPSIYN